MICKRRRIKLKSTGIVRKVDELGRVVLPVELRRNLDIEIRDSLEIFVDDRLIILKKYEPGDIFTGNMNDLIDYHGKKVSKETITDLVKLAGLELKEVL
jgi:transcriptional pleiotropic regulator of transition state genes